jgi:hypothetical protein
MRRFCMAAVVLAVLAFYAAPAGAEEPTESDAQEVAQLPPFIPPFDDGGACTGVPDAIPGIFDFTEACERHDACYAAGGDRSECDLAFHEDLIAACLSQHPDPFDPRRHACLAFADLYFFGVTFFAQFFPGGVPAPG